MSDALAIQGVEIVDFARNTAAVLREPGLLFGAGYKVLRSQDAESLVPCSRMDLNGCPVLVYSTRGYVTLEQFARESSLDTVCRTLRSLIDAVVAVRGNGFLSDRNLLLSGSTVYVDPASNGARLIYLPLTVAAYAQSDVAVGRCVYELAQEAVGSVGGVDAAVLQSQRGAYERGDLDALRDELMRVPQRGAQRRVVAQHLTKDDTGTGGTPGGTPGGTGGGTGGAKPGSRTGDRTGPGTGGDTGGDTGTSPRSKTPEKPKVERPRKPETPPRTESGAVYALTARSARGPVNYRISGARTVLGKSSGRADVVVGLSSSISRAHCELCVRPDGSLTVKDLQSMNGTYVNGKRLQPNAEAPLPAGSTLKLADVTFLVQRVR